MAEVIMSVSSRCKCRGNAYIESKQMSKQCYIESLQMSRHCYIVSMEMSI